MTKIASHKEEELLKQHYSIFFCLALRVRWEEEEERERKKENVTTAVGVALRKPVHQQIRSTDADSM